MKSKLYSVRIPAVELPIIEGVFAAFPGVSPALLIRALLLDAKKTQVGNALARHAKGGKP